jgi:hypothetical protein|tara:strand:- start:501 stop:917 length:417 start_codon:yes stop_codon:yes gene_type:complete
MTDMTFDYSEDCISDLHKEVYGCRPTSGFWSDWNNCTPAEKQKTWDEYCDALEVKEMHEKKIAILKVNEFKDRIHQAQTWGAHDYWDALRWITGSEKFYHIQDVEHFVWEQGILFTDYGKQIVKDLAKIVKYEEYDWG